MRFLAACALVAGLLAAPVAAEPACQFVLGFADFRAQTGDLVGDCLEDQRTLTQTETFNLPGSMTGTVNAGYAVQVTTRGLLWWDIPTNAVKFADSQGIWHMGDAGLSLTRWETLGVAPAPPGDPPAWSQPMPAAPQAPVAPRGPDPALVSQCMAVADDLTRTMGTDDPRVYFSLLGECERAVASHGARGLQCFEIAWRPMARILLRTKPGSRAVFNAIEGAYQGCVSTR